MRRPLMLILFLALCIDMNASELVIENVRPSLRTELGEKPSVIFDIKWNNAWNNSKNHDAVWIFAKFSSAWEHPKMAPEGHRILQNRIDSCPDPIFEVSKDSLGLILRLGTSYRGNVNYKVQIFLDDTSQEIDFRKLTGFKLFGLEMVFVPKGPFTLGSPDTTSTRYASFYKSDSNGERNGLFQITSENEIQVGPDNGNLYYWSESSEYNGDQKGPIPSSFPKGFEAFYIMKYELTQGQYAAFLNHIPDDWTYSRASFAGRGYYDKRGGIRFDGNVYVADSYRRPMNFVSWTDGIAFTDWACLRPLTELEYEKAARGPSTPMDREFVWGTDNYDLLERYVNLEHELVFTNGLDESQLTDETREIFGASYYWVMDLSGSVWEKVITIGNPKGRTFSGSHGNGLLDTGFADNKDWPLLDEHGGGFGYRGGGFYNRYLYGVFNPHSPIGYRYYGAWSGGPRSIAYGYRAGRTAE